MPLPLTSSCAAESSKTAFTRPYFYGLVFSHTDNNKARYLREKESFMFTFETADQKEVRRFRIAQFNGRTATVRSGGTTITGHVRSVLESKTSVPARWTITII